MSLNAAKQYVMSRNVIDATFDDYIREFIANEQLLARWLHLRDTDRDLLKSEVARAIYTATFDDPIKSKVLAIAATMIQPDDVIKALEL
jgi:hypothetical protein